MLWDRSTDRPGRSVRPEQLLLPTIPSVLWHRSQQGQAVLGPIVAPIPPSLKGSGPAPGQLQSNQLPPSRGQQSPCLALPESSQFPSKMRKADGSSPSLMHRWGLVGQQEIQQTQNGKKQHEPNKRLLQRSLSRCGFYSLITQQVGGENNEKWVSAIGRVAPWGAVGLGEENTPLSVESDWKQLPVGPSERRGPPSVRWGQTVQEGSQVTDKRRTRTVRNGAGAALRGASETVTGRQKEAFSIGQTRQKVFLTSRGGRPRAKVHPVSFFIALPMPTC